MAKGKRATQPQGTPWSRWVMVLAGLAIAGGVVWWVARPTPTDIAAVGGEEPPGATPQPLDLSVGGPSIEAAAELDVPADSVASAGADLPGGVNVSNDPRLGPATAPVTIVEFSDFQCPHCATFHQETFPALRTLYGDQVQWIFVNRFFPAAHPMAESAALAAECATRQGKFWEYAEGVFANQAELDRDLLFEQAEEVGLDEAAFRQCLESGVTASEVAADQAEGDRLRVDGTPTFFVNGERLVGAQPPAVFNQAIRPHLR